MPLKTNRVLWRERFLIKEGLQGSQRESEGSDITVFLE